MSSSDFGGGWVGGSGIRWPLAPVLAQRHYVGHTLLWLIKNSEWRDLLHSLQRDFYKMISNKIEKFYSLCLQPKKKNITFTPLNLSKKWDYVLFCSDNFCDGNLWESRRAWTWSSWYSSNRLIITLCAPPPTPPGEQGETNQVLTHFNTFIEWFCPFSSLFVILFWHLHDGKLTEANSALILLRLWLYFFSTANTLWSQMFITWTGETVSIVLL